MIRKSLISLFICILTLGCQTIQPPIEEWVLARAAVDAAKSVQAAKYSPGYWHQAEEAYKRARIFFKEESFKEAKSEFTAARKAAERAENSARLKRFQNGEVL